MTLTVGSLFSGIGGLDLGLERAGMTVVWQSEIDPYASRVLAKHWPTVPNLGDITTVDWSTVESPDVICGGYPCQPFSLAGTRAGTDDPRHLWPHFHRAIRHLRPRYALLENVRGHLSLGFDRVLGDLADIGYDVEWCCIPAAAVGAPHLRWRLFAVAYPQRGELRQQPVSVFRSGSAPFIGDDGTAWAVADADSTEWWPDAEGRDDEPDGDDPGRQETASGPRMGSEALAHADHGGRDGRTGQLGPRRRSESPDSSRPVADPAGERRPRRVLARPHLVDDGPQPAHGHAGVGGDAGWWEVEPDVGRVAHGVPSRVDRLRCLGNAVVPQVAQWVGERIMEAAA